MAVNEENRETTEEGPRRLLLWGRLFIQSLCLAFTCVKLLLTGNLEIAKCFCPRQEEQEVKGSQGHTVRVCLKTEQPGDAAQWLRACNAREEDRPC